MRGKHHQKKALNKHCGCRELNRKSWHFYIDLMRNNSYCPWNSQNLNWKMMHTAKNQWAVESSDCPLSSARWNTDNLFYEKRNKRFSAFLNPSPVEACERRHTIQSLWFLFQLIFCIGSVKGKMLIPNHRVHITSSLNKKGLQKITVVGEEQEKFTGRIVKAVGEIFMSTTYYYWELWFTPWLTVLYF